MKRRLPVALAIAVACASAWVAISWYQTPRFKGKPVRTWINLASYGNPEAIATLRELGTNAAPDFARALKKQDSRIHKALWNFQRKLHPRLRQSLFKKLGPPIAWDERARAARALAAIGLDARWSLPYLAQALHDPENEVCYNSANAMGHMGKAAVSYLVDALGDYDPNRRRALVNALAQIGPEAEAAVPALTEILSDTDQEVRSRAAYALGSIGAPWLKRLTTTISEGSSDARITAAKELLLIYPAPLQVAKALFAMAHDPAPATRRQAIETLGIIRPLHSGTIPTLTAGLADDTPEVRTAAARSLGLMGNRAKPASVELSKALEDKEEAVRSAAKEALARIEEQKP